MLSKMTNAEQEASGVMLFGSRTLVPVLIDAQPPDFRLQSLPWNAEFRGGSGRSGYVPMALRESGFDHLPFTICQRQERFVWARRIGRFALWPALIHYEGIVFTQNNGALDDVLQFADIAGPLVRS
jgi:hypothetical protein